MTPAVMWCENNCVHCWRPIEYNLGTNLGEYDGPKEILEGIIKKRKELMMGLKGAHGVDPKKFEEALEPKLFTMSLSGEPTIYPRLGDLFEEIRKRGAVSFLVTNGMNPEALRKMAAENKLPTQITVSTNAPNKELFIRWVRSSKQNAWEVFNETLDVIRELKGKVRRVIRLTLAKPGTKEGPFKDLTNMKNEHVEQYADLIRKAEPEFIHVKGYKALGYSRDRLGYDKQPLHEEVREFAEKLEKELEKDNYYIAMEDVRSCVVLIAKKGVEIQISQI